MNLKLQKKGISLLEIINSMFLVGLLFVIFSIFYVYSSRNSKVLNSRFDAQNEASINMKRMVEEISLSNGYEIINSSYLRIRRDTNGTPSDFSDDTWEEFQQSGGQLVYTVVPPSGNSYSRVLSSSIDSLSFSSSGTPNASAISIALTIKKVDYTFSLSEIAVPRSMSLQ